MKQLLKIKKKIVLKKVPAPVCGPEDVLVKNKLSVILGNVEKDILTANKGGIINKIFSQKDLLEFAVRKIKKEGLLKTYAFGKAIMSNWHTLGLLSTGEVIEVGRNVQDVKVGDLVVCAGWHLANHASYVALPRESVALVKSKKDLELGLIAGYGAKMMSLIDLIQIPKKSSVLIFGYNSGSDVLYQLLKYFGYQPKIFLNKSGGQSLEKDFDIVRSFKNLDRPIDFLFTVHQNPSQENLERFKKILGKNGKYIAITEKNIAPTPQIKFEKYRFFLAEKQMKLQPEEKLKTRLTKRLDQKKFNEFLNLVSQNKINLSGLLEKKIEFTKIEKVYKTDLSKIFSVLVNYNPEKTSYKRTIRYFKKNKPTGLVGVAVIGAGNMARDIHIPIIRNKKECFIKYIMTKSGRSAASIAHHYKIPFATSSYQTILEDPEIDIVVILTHHSSHAHYVTAAIKAGKNVFVEKPLALTIEECEKIKKACKKNPVVFSVGLNKTFSPLAQKLKSVFKNRKGPLLLTYRLQTKINLNKGWYYNPKIGGGRLIGEYCHLFDFAYWLIGSSIKKIEVSPLTSNNPYLMKESNLIVNLSFSDGSVASLICSEDGSSKIPKERVEVICENNVAIIEDWESININGKWKKTGMKKGYQEHWNNFLVQVRKKKAPLIDIDRAVEVMKICFAAAKKLEDLNKKTK